TTLHCPLPLSRTLRHARTSTAIYTRPLHDALPISLLRRIIAASSNPGDRVADVFAGSGTTAAVAAELGRRFVICDHADAAVQIRPEEHTSELQSRENVGRRLLLGKKTRVIASATRG